MVPRGNSSLEISVLRTLDSADEFYFMENFDLKNLIIRPVELSDLEEIKKVTQITWLETYPNEEHGITREDIMEMFGFRDTERDMQERISRVQTLPDKRDYLVAEYDGNIIGFTRIHRLENEYKLSTIYILPEFQKLRIGRKLYETLMEPLDKNIPLFLLVAAYNKNAIEFYKRLGFVPDPAPKEEYSFSLPNGKVIPEIKMIKKI